MKRYGYDELSSFGVSTTSLQSVIGIAQFKNQGKEIKFSIEKIEQIINTLK